MPVAIGFTVETDGRLPSGQALGDAIDARSTRETAGGPDYYLINCAHPTHFAHVLEADEPWLDRILGLRANASTKSHAELDEATELDEGNPEELGCGLRAPAAQPRRRDGARGLLRHRRATRRRDRRGLALRGRGGPMSAAVVSARVSLNLHAQGDPSGVPVVLLHGLSDSRHSWDLVLPQLPAGVRALAVSQRGHGDSERPATGYRMRDFSGDVVDLLDALEIEQAVVVGHSLGSTIARRFAADNPERTSGLVLVGSFAVGPGNPAVVELSEIAAELPELDPRLRARVPGEHARAADLRRSTCSC